MIKATIGYRKLRTKNSETDERYRNILKYIEDNPNSGVARIVELDADNPILDLLLTEPTGKLLEIVEEDFNDPRLKLLEASPDSLDRVINNTLTPVEELKIKTTSKLLTDFDKMVDAISTILDERVYIRETEYFTTFHRMFYDENIPEDELAKLKASWLDKAKSFLAPVHIIDDEGETILFKHPGLMGELFGVNGHYNSWLKFKETSAYNENRLAGMKETFQNNYFGDYLESLTSARKITTKEGVEELYKIHKYFLNNYPEVHGLDLKEDTISEDKTEETVVKETSNVEKYQDDWDF